MICAQVWPTEARAPGATFGNSIWELSAYTLKTLMPQAPPRCLQTWGVRATRPRRLTPLDCVLASAQGLTLDALPRALRLEVPELPPRSDCLALLP